MDQSSNDSEEIFVISLKWGKILYDEKLVLNLSSKSLANELKKSVQELTKVPISRQKLLCPKCWKGTLKNDQDNDDILRSFITLQKKKKKNKTVVVTLIGSIDVLEERPSLEELVVTTKTKSSMHQNHDDNSNRHVPTVSQKDTNSNDNMEVDIVALQKEPGIDRDDGKMEMYQYNRLVTGLPQHQIQDKLRRRTKILLCNDNHDDTQLLGELAMTMGMELSRAYVNSLAVLKDEGTIVSGLDDGHVQMWHRGERIYDRRHSSGVVDHVIALDNGGFATAGNGQIIIWNPDGERIWDFMTPPGTTPASLATGSRNSNNNNNNNNSDNTFTYLASCFRLINRQTNNHLFRLTPQDEAGRLRQAAAQAQERMIQNSLTQTCQCIQLWYHSTNNDDHTSNNGFRTAIITPNNLNDDDDEFTSPAITHLLDLNGQLISGDEYGGIQLFQWTEQAMMNATSDSSFLSPRRIKFLQLHCPGYNCSISCMESMVRKDQQHLLAISINPTNHNGARTTTLMSLATPISLPNPPSRSSIILLDINTNRVRAILDGAHSKNDIVQCICPLPDGGILSAGGKMDATIQLWQPLPEQNHDNSDDQNNTTVPTQIMNAKKLKEPGYVFDLKVLPDSSGSDVYAIAGARYNVIKIVI